MHDNAEQSEIIKLIQTFCVMACSPDRRRFFILNHIPNKMTKKFNHVKFATTLSNKRIKNGITVRSLSSDIGISYETLRRYEKNGWAGDQLGYCTPDLEAFHKVCAWLNTPMESFFTSK